MGPDNVHEEHREYSTDGRTENARVMKAHAEMWVMTLNNPYRLIYCTVVESLHFIPNKQLDIWPGLFKSPVHM
jgi:hypothetical protein